MKKDIIIEGKSLEETTQDKRVLESETERQTNVKTSNFTDKFDVKYLKEGVCLRILKYYADDLFMINDIINYLDTKKVTGYDLERIKKIVKRKDTELMPIAPYQNENLIDSKLNIYITNDIMEAYATLLPAYGGRKLTLEGALNQIREKKISYGILENVVKNIIEQEKYDIKTLIAKGMKPVNAKKGYLTNYFEQKKDLSPELLEDGTVDYRNLHIVQNVKEGQLLCELTEPILGEDGINVLGAKVAHKPAKEVYIKHGKNVALSDDAKKLYADKNGQIKIIDGKINVLDIYEVDGNVDNKTGNIEFNGSVLIKGNVKSGFEINAYGDIIVEGVVEGARINSQSNITLKRGIQGGKKAYLTANGDIASKYIESCKIFCKGNVVAHAIMHSEIACEGNIYVNQNKGLIVGGYVKAKQEIHAKTIGSEMETRTLIEVGVDPKVKERYNDVITQLNTMRKNIEKLDKNINLLNRLLKAGRMDSNKKELLIRSLKTRKALSVEYGKLNIEKDSLVSQMSELSKGAVFVNRVMHPGVKITIGNDVMFVKQEYARCKIYNKDNEIAIGSLN
ncbi:DUF342 domain-containing protein [Abyssisolibacter fermentans]|uniref:DUF342 domain-containing protein n=1 Tax=Abyssisolibacter fermentans TaxID=1766203 RepID=UPI00082AFE5A|nr:FapA family protein [Abyssisolibacter fermentans]